MTAVLKPKNDWSCPYRKDEEVNSQRPKKIDHSVEPGGSRTWRVFITALMGLFGCSIVLVATVACTPEEDNARFWGAYESLSVPAGEGEYSHIEWRVLSLDGPSGLLNTVLDTFPEVPEPQTTSGIAWPGLPDGQKAYACFRRVTNGYVRYDLVAACKETGLTSQVLTRVSLFRGSELQTTMHIELRIGGLNLISAPSELKEVLGEPIDHFELDTSGRVTVRAKWKVIIGEAPRRTLMKLAVTWEDGIVDVVTAEFYYEEQVIDDLTVGAESQ